MDYIYHLRVSCFRIRGPLTRLCVPNRHNSLSPETGALLGIIKFFSYISLYLNNEAHSSYVAVSKFNLTAEGAKDRREKIKFSANSAFSAVNFLHIFLMFC